MIKIKTHIIYIAIFLFIPASSAFGFTILAFGDSITQGYQRAAGTSSPYSCPFPKIGNSQTSCGYTDELTQKLNSSEEPSAVYNWGWAGETVTFDNLSGVDPNYRYSSGVDRFVQMINATASANINFVLIHEGTNDLAARSAGAIASGLESMVSYSLSRNIVPIIATITPRTDNFTSTSRHLSLNELIKDIGKRYEIPVADMYSALGGFNGFEPYHSGDRLHINDLGYNIMADEWLRAIQLYQAQNKQIIMTPIINLILD